MSRAVKIIIFIVLLLVSLGMASAGVLLAYQGAVMPVFNKVVRVPFVEKSAVGVVHAMASKMPTINTAQYEVSAVVAFSDPKYPVSIESTMIFNGGVEEELKGQLISTNSITVNQQTFFFDFEVTATNGKTYFKVTELPALPVVDLDVIRGVVYEYPKNVFQEQSLPSAGALASVLNNSNFLKSLERLPDENLSILPSYHLSASLSGTDLEKIVTVQPWIADRIDVKNLSTLDLELWIDKTSYVLQRVTADYVAATTKVQIQIDITNINETIKLEYPSEGYPLKTFTRDLFEKTNFLDLPLFSYVIGLNAGEWATDRDEDGLYFVWERLFGSDPGKSDTDGDGYSDGEEVKNGYKPTGSGALVR